MLAPVSTWVKAMMLADFSLAIVHHLTMFALVTVLVLQITLVRPAMDAARISRVARLDRAYGPLALLMLVAGFARVFYGLKDPGFYVSNPVFWAKIAAFLAVAVLSIVPTRLFLRWARASIADITYRPSADDISTARRYLHLEAAVFLTIPILAAAMARGLGL
ncbi:MAG: DUF2214 family protein [Alphaproteobacteria bacterium]